MSWFKRAAESRRSPSLREVVLALAELEAKMAIDLSRLQGDVASQGTIIESVAARVAALEAGQGSSVDQAAVDALAATVEGNNAALTALATAPST
jgi:hypothetical protein